MIGNQANISGTIRTGDVYQSVQQSTHIHSVQQSTHIHSVQQSTHIHSIRAEPDDQQMIADQIQSLLKNRYKNIRIQTAPWLDDWDLPLKDYFVHLTMTHKTDMTFQRPPKSVLLQDIFRPTKGATPTRILIEGAAGYGKTTLAHKLCYDYGNSEVYVKQFQHVILIHLRELEGTLEEMILQTLKFKDHHPEDVLQLVQNKQEEIMYILDGLDELPQSKYKCIIPLLKKEKYPCSTVVVTSRIGSIQIDKKDLSFNDVLKCYDRRIEIKGVTGKRRMKFMSTYLSKYPKNKVKHVKSLLNTKFGFQFNDAPVYLKHFVKVKRLFFPLPSNDDLFESPLFLLLLFTLVLNTDIQQINSKTDLYKALFNFVVRRSLAKNMGPDQPVDLFNFNQENPSSYVSLMIKFGELALQALVTNKINISQEIIKKYFGEDKTFLTFGFLTQNSTIEGVTQRLWFEPVHFSLMEFAAAYYFFSKPARPLISHLCVKFPFLPEKSSVLSFYVGLVKEKLFGGNEMKQTSDIYLLTLVSLNYTLSVYPLFSVYLLNVAQLLDIKEKGQIYAFLSLCAAATASIKADKAVDPILDLGKLALEVLRCDSHYISKESLQSIGYENVETIVELGFLMLEESTQLYKPAHQSLLEFSAACHVTEENVDPLSNLPENVQKFFEILKSN